MYTCILESFLFSDLNYTYYINYVSGNELTHIDRFDLIRLNVF